MSSPLPTFLSRRRSISHPFSVCRSSPLALLLSPLFLVIYRFTHRLSVYPSVFFLLLRSSVCAFPGYALSYTYLLLIHLSASLSAFQPASKHPPFRLSMVYLTDRLRLPSAVLLTSAPFRLGDRNRPVSFPSLFLAILNFLT